MKDKYEKIFAQQYLFATILDNWDCIRNIREYIENTLRKYIKRYRGFSFVATELIQNGIQHSVNRSCHVKFIFNPRTKKASITVINKIKNLTDAIDLCGYINWVNCLDDVNVIRAHILKNIEKYKDTQHSKRGLLEIKLRNIKTIINAEYKELDNDVFIQISLQENIRED